MGSTYQLPRLTLLRLGSPASVYPMARPAADDPAPLTLRHAFRFGLEPLGVTRYTARLCGGRVWSAAVSGSSNGNLNSGDE